MYFMQYLATIIAWKIAVSEHLEWLKFQKLSGGSACESLREGGGGREGVQEVTVLTSPPSCIGHCLPKCENKMPLD